MKPMASLSLDVDNLWSYMKIHGDIGWETFPSYLGRFVPIVLDLLREHELRITFFLVGQDAAVPGHHEVLAQIPRDGHEVANHSFRHEPWLHRYGRAEVETELARAEDSIEAATGCRPRGFRGPGFSISAVVLNALRERGYHYDASTLPSYVGPLARTWYFFRSNLDQRARAERQQLFGSWRDGLRPIRPYRWRLEQGTLLEIPVTTVPVLRSPFHLSYVLYLSAHLPSVAREYFRGALWMCRATGVQPSILLHPLDFLGADEVEGLSFFPGMQIPGIQKRERVAEYLCDLKQLFRVVPLGVQADSLEHGGKLAERRPGPP